MFHPDRPPISFKVGIGKVAEKTDVETSWGNYLSGANLRRDSGKVNQDVYKQKTPLRCGALCFIFYLDQDQTASPLLISGGPEKY